VRPQDLADRVRPVVPDVVIARDEVTAIAERERLLEIVAWGRDDQELELGFLSCISATHWPDAQPAFWVSYELRSITKMHRLRLKVGLSEADAHVPSVTGLFPTANWLERETFDFFGVVFDGHPDLTRIMLPDDWEGYPLRKDEPLGGVPTWYHGATIPPVDQRGMA
jgi:NADH-quinone oxidoreductase subunit C